MHRRRFLRSSALGVGMLMTRTADGQSSDFALHQQERRRELWSLLGDLPTKHVSQPARVVRTEARPTYLLEHLELDLNGIEPVPAYLLIPNKRTTPKAPGLLYLHAHVSDCSPHSPSEDSGNERCDSLLDGLILHVCSSLGE